VQAKAAEECHQKARMNRNSAQRSKEIFFQVEKPK
jgi:hypothetical protein